MKSDLFLIIFLQLLILVISVSILKNGGSYLNADLNRNKTNNNNFTLNNNSTNNCKTECENVAKIWGCFCDPICLDFKDCCNLYRKNCSNYFDSNSNFPNRNRSKLTNNTNNTNSTDVNGSCCNPSMNMKCFCDDNCLENGDCCQDYQKCKAQRVKNNFDSLRFNQKNVIQPSPLWKSTLTPQIQTIYLISGNTTIDKINKNK